VTTELDWPFAESALAVNQVVAEVVVAVREKRGAPVDVQDVRALVEREWARYETAPVRAFLPVLVRRAVIDDVLGRR
jgi:hypothetical protein